MDDSIQNNLDQVLRAINANRSTKPHYVYLLRRADRLDATGKPQVFYVGQGQRERAFVHLDWKDTANPEKCYTVRCVGDALRIEIVDHFVTEIQARIVETCFIILYNRFYANTHSPKLTNKVYSTKVYQQTVEYINDFYQPLSSRRKRRPVSRRPVTPPSPFEKIRELRELEEKSKEQFHSRFAERMRQAREGQKAWDTTQSKRLKDRPTVNKYCYTLLEYGGK